MAHVTHYEQVDALTLNKVTDPWNGVSGQHVGSEHDAFCLGLRFGAHGHRLEAVSLINLLLDHLVNGCRETR